MQVDPVAFGHAEGEQAVGGPVDDPVELPIGIAMTLLLRVLEDEERLVRLRSRMVLKDFPQCTLPNDGHGHSVLLQAAGMTGSTLISYEHRCANRPPYGPLTGVGIRRFVPAACSASRVGARHAVPLQKTYPCQEGEGGGQDMQQGEINARL